ncbi:MAG: TM0106 family RecB-like putative nuclease [Frankiales bacterium]|nr:TM0106 family RecB-like putative nuclease [Frankiales bacterium]
MFLLDGTVVHSASDLATAARCEFATLRALDVKLKRAAALVDDDAMLARTARLGEAHEQRVLGDYLAVYGVHAPGRQGGVATIDPPLRYDLLGLTAAREATLVAIQDGADVVYQGSFFDGRFHGRADFLVRRDGAYVVQDTKLARHAKVEALLQVAAYADQLARQGVPVSNQVVLVLGDRVESMHPTQEILPVYVERRTRLEEILDLHLGETDAVAWGDDRWSACGRCGVCQSEVAAARDVLLVAGMRMTQRAKLREAGIYTIEDLAATTVPVDGITASTLATLQEQAALQVAQDNRPLREDGYPEVRAVVHSKAALEALPAPDPGDIFFDFEGDPLWSEDGSSDWGLEYLFGVVEGDTGAFLPFWAHDRVEERQALIDFLDYLADRRARFPGMHVYHYASYEKTALLRLTARHAVGEEAVDDLLRAGVLVDLYSTVRHSIRVSQPSYSIKKLEPLYMGDDLRDDDGVTTAGDSIEQYRLACEARDRGENAEFDRLIAAIADYNHYDCRSTLRLRGWLLERAREIGVVPVESVADDEFEPEQPDQRELDLRALAGEEPASRRTPEQTAYAMLASALGYHRRERKPFWWSHFDRFSTPVGDWSLSRDVFVVERGEVLQDWHVPARARTQHRVLRLVGSWGPGSTADSRGVFVLHDPPVPGCHEVPVGGVRGFCHGDIEQVGIDVEGEEYIVLRERIARDVGTYGSMPMAVTPDAPPGTGHIEGALREIADLVIVDGLVPSPGLDVLLRRRPRTEAGSLPRPGEGRSMVDVICAAVASLDRSYIAVQGPPGTGKTYVGARVVAALVERGWRVGVVGQSHAVVEHFLDSVVDAGVSRDQVGKGVAKHTAAPAWTALGGAEKLAGYLDEHARVGCVVGGTAWDLCHAGRVPRGSLDLLVIDEAGQFSLANTLAVSVAAQRLLLLGDPQQLPQVSQGTHPEPVDGSALGWLNEGHAVLPAERGYFLEKSWRMHPALCERVSLLSYDGQLRSQEPQTTGRSLDGVDPGLRVVTVDHLGNAVSSPEEADVVVRRVRELLGRRWFDPAVGVDRALGEEGVLVVAAYNAQVKTVSQALAAAGLTRVRVGTVDKLQGQEAPIVIVSMAASSPEDVPRGMEFLLSRNRVNVAVSRAQWLAIVIRSPRLTHYLPATVTGLEELGAFLRLQA